VLQLDLARIERALAQRTRYRYVQPRVERAGAGWKIVSPNCSRNVDPSGGEIDIAWFQPNAAIGADGPRWQVHARDHATGCWTLQAHGLTLTEALALVCADPLRVYWP
jgi:hypothetical protein